MLNYDISYINNKNNPIELRAQAAGELWELLGSINKTLKSFKKELISEAERVGKDLTIYSGDFRTEVQKQPPTPKIDTFDPDTLREELGDALFEKYIAHSYTIKWSEFRNAPPHIKDVFFSVPGLELTQTHQVKFNRKGKKSYP